MIVDSIMLNQLYPSPPQLTTERLVLNMQRLSSNRPGHNHMVANFTNYGAITAHDLESYNDYIN